eukprot:jgi/Mesvir1/26595/Mv09566-RA.1
MAMLYVESSAPGKVILFGEHAVVHGATAVAAALDLRTKVTLRLGEAPGVLPHCVSLELPVLGVHCVWLVGEIEAALFDPASRRRDAGEASDASTSLDEPSMSTVLEGRLATLVMSQLGPMGKKGGGHPPPPDAGHGHTAGMSAWEQHGSTLTALLFFIASILGPRPATIRVESELPIGAGLGSSASLCVAFCSALLAAVGAVGAVGASSGGGGRDGHPAVGDDDGSKDASGGAMANVAARPLALSAADMARVNRWAFEGEKIIHGRPSGIDNAISCFGGLVNFSKGQVQSLTRDAMPLRVLLTNTGVQRSTKRLVAHVGACAQRHPHVFQHIFDTVDAIASEGFQLVTAAPAPALPSASLPAAPPQGGTVDSHSAVPSARLPVSQAEQRVGELITLNRHLLEAMGVGHAAIQRIYGVADAHGLPSKLTGAGGGGCVITLLPCTASGDGNDVGEQVSSQLKAAGYQCLEAALGTPGVQIAIAGSP